MKPLRFVAILALVLMFFGGCKGCICSNIAKSISEKPTDEEVKENAKKALEKSPAKLSTICGVRVSALKDMVVTLVKSEIGKHTVKVEGTSVYALPDAGPLQDDEADDVDGGDGDDDDDNDAGIDVRMDVKLDAGRDAASKDAGVKDAGVAAAATAAASSAAKKNAEPPIVTNPTKLIACAAVVTLSITAVLDTDGTRKGWDTSNLEIESVSTPGVKYEKPSTPSGGGGSHHRRHHHH